MIGAEWCPFGQPHACCNITCTVMRDVPPVTTLTRAVNRNTAIKQAKPKAVIVGSYADVAPRVEKEADDTAVDSSRRAVSPYNRDGAGRLTPSPAPRSSPPLGRRSG
jgi:hypothetical protein